jgi:hypothetical protein
MSINLTVMNALPSVNTMLEKKYKGEKLFFIPPLEER